MASRIVINNQITFTNADIDVGSISVEKATDLVGEELSADELNFKVFYDDSSNTLRNMDYAAPVVYYENENIVGTFYLVSVTRTAQRRYSIQATSMIGVLSKEMHYGGMLQNDPFKAMLDSVFLTDGLTGEYYKRRIFYWPRTTMVGSGKRYGVSVGANRTFEARSRMVAEFEYYGVHPEWSDGYAYEYLYGTSEYRAGTTQYRYYVMLYTRSYSSRNAGELWLNLYGTSYRIARGIIPGAKVYFDINPVAGTVVCIVDGVTYTTDISACHSADMYANNPSLYKLHYYGGMAQDTYPNGADMVYKTFILYNSSGQQTCSYTSYYDLIDHRFCVIDWYYGSNTSVTTLKPGKMVVSTTANENVFSSQKQAEMLDSISYLNNCDEMRLSGWLDVATKRQQLFQMLFALNLNMRSDSSGKLSIGGLSNASVKTIPQASVYNTGSEKKLEKTRHISLTEHVYTATSTTAQIFDNTNTTALTDKIVQYSSAPIVGAPVATGLTVTAFNCNAALVSGTGKLTGTLYDHSEIVHGYDVSSDIDGREVSVTNATLVTFLNYSVVMDRLKAFYNNLVSEIENDLVYGGELCGNKYTFLSPFGDNVSAFLSKITATTTSFAKLKCKFYRNYNPPSIGTDYKNFALLTGRGTWTRPTGVTKIKVVLIGGGSGGSSGLAGEQGFVPSYQTEVTESINQARGGAAGTNGNGGNIYETEISSPSASYSYACGAGGNGGAVTSSTETPNSGTAGGATTFGSFSSNSGSPRANGFTNLLSGLRYGYTPQDYSSMMKGGDGGYLYKNSSGIHFVDGESVTNPFTGVTYRGGVSTQGGLAKSTTEFPLGQTYVSNSCGSGAFFNGNGLGGNLAYKSGQFYVQNNGAAANRNPIATKTADTYGCGGYCGFGGAAGGCTSYYTQDGKDYFYQGTATTPFGQNGGAGSGGYAGCILVFW